MFRKARANPGSGGFVPRGAGRQLTEVLQDGERVLWTGAPDPMATLRTQRVWWWIGVPWIVVAALLSALGLIPWSLDFYLLVVGGVFLAAPILMTFHAGGTVYAITDRRAILKHDALGQHQLVDVPLAALDRTFEILPTGRHTGHLYIASNMKSRIAYADHTGRLAFRELRDPEAVRDLLERIRERHARDARSR